MRKQFGLLMMAMLLFAAGCESGESARGPAAVYQDRLAAADRSAEAEADAGAAMEQDAEAAEADATQQLFDGTTLDGWEVSDFAGHGDVYVDNGNIILDFAGNGLTGVTWEDGESLPRDNYEVSLQAKRVEGNDFFCGLTFPVEDDHCSLIVGGWGGTVVGLSSVDGFDASQNDTTRIMTFEPDRWYDIRVRVADDRIQAWIDDEQVIDLDTTNRSIDIRYEIGESRPLGVAAYNTVAAIRDIELTRLD